MVSSSFFTIVVILCAAGGSAAIEWKNLRVSIGRYHEIPLTMESLIQTKNYSLMVRDHDLNLNFFAFKNDPRVSIGFDSYGNIGGIRVSYIKSDLPTKGNANNLSFPHEFYDKPYYSSGIFLSTEVWYVDILFVHPDTLRAGGRQETGGLVGEDVFVKVSGEWTTIPRLASEAPSQGFSKQGCTPVMGMHYFYNIGTESDCMTLQPVFGLYEGDDMIGLGLATLGMQYNTTDRTWMENSPRELFQIITPNRPACLLDLLDNYGVTALHFFFKEDYLSTQCD